ncbi:hypothetical protein LRR80_05223 [Streptomyces sp. RO-S4]|nr:hypothetical protein [Streptomyces sp. RO-S4]
MVPFGGKCERVDKWREDAQPGRPQPADAARRFAEGDEDAREARVLPLAERPAEPGVRDGADSLRAGSGSLDERWARLGVFPSGNGMDDDRTQILPPSGTDDRTQMLPPSGTEDRTQVLPGTGGRPTPSGGGDGFSAFGKAPAPAERRSEGGGDGFSAFRKTPRPAERRTDDAYDSERTTALRVPRPPAPSAGPAVPADTGTTVRDPWQEDTGADATHDPHEVTVQLDAVQIGAGGVLSRTPGAGAAPEAAPVFVDESGRRNRLYRRIGLAVGLACAGYAVVMVATLLSGNSDAPWMPVPGQEGKPAEQVETTPKPSAADPTPSAGTSLQPGSGAPSLGASDVPTPGVSAPVAGGTGGTVKQPDGGAPATTPAGRASSQPATGGTGGGATTDTPPAGGGGTTTQPSDPVTTEAPPPDPTATTGGGEAGGTDNLAAPPADQPVAAEPAAGADAAPAAAPSPENVL